MSLEVQKVNAMAANCGKWVIHGPTGSGKTTLAATIAGVGGRTLFLDLPGEKGSRSLQGSPYADVIDVVSPTTLKDLDTIFYALMAGPSRYPRGWSTTPYRAVVIDSISAVARLVNRHLLIGDETATQEIAKDSVVQASFTTWGKSAAKLTGLVDNFTSLASIVDRQYPLHVVIIAQTKMRDDEISGRTTRSPDIQPAALGPLMASCDYAVYCDTEPVAIDTMAEDDPLASAVRHIVRFGKGEADYATKGRIPQHLWGRIPPILGRNGQLSLTALSRLLQIGGIDEIQKEETTKKSN